MPGSYATVTIAFKIVYKLRALVITVDRRGCQLLTYVPVTS